MTTSRKSTHMEISRTEETPDTEESEGGISDWSSLMSSADEEYDDEEYDDDEYDNKSIISSEYDQQITNDCRIINGGLRIYQHNIQSISKDLAKRQILLDHLKAYE